MRIALAQINVHIGNFEANTKKIIDYIHQAKAQGADLVVFPELCVCGYPPRDFLEFDDFIDLCQQAVATIAQHCQGIAALVGAPTRNPSTKGKRLYNSAYLLCDQRITSITHKTLLPTYDIFDEYRYFEPADQHQVIMLQNHRIAVTICEDIWNFEQHALYDTSPMDTLITQKPDIIINLSASPYSYKQQQNRTQILQLNARTYNIPVVYVNHCGAQTELIFDGNSRVVNNNGDEVLRLKNFEEDLQIIDTKTLSPISTQTLSQTLTQKEATENPSIATPNYAHIHQALLVGIKDYFDKLGFKKAIIGLSGGIDSALVSVLAAQALGNENVHVLLMPSEFSSVGSIDDSLKLIKNLNITHDIVPIKVPFDTITNDVLKPFFNDLPFGIAEENIQSRLRGLLLMAYTNKFGYILLNTSNKSELAVGYGTLYGDMAGGISVIGDLYKTQVYALCDHINKTQEIIPTNILTKAPSAELRPNQKDSDSLPEYDLLDPVLMQYIENRRSPEEIIAQGYDPKIVTRTLRLVNINEYKRNQFCPILRISGKAFGAGRRMPIVGKYLG
jgi:NAD+ synthase (glutamine-hydrolysing)